MSQQSADGRASLVVRPASECALDEVSLGEVMLRLDPGAGRIHTARRFQVWEGGGEYNVARGLRRCFGHRTAIVTALVDNPVGRLVEDLMLQGGVDLSYVRWVTGDGVGRQVRNGLNFTERGFGPRAGLGCSDRGHTAVSQLRPGDIDFAQLFGRGVRWFHTGGVFCGLSDTTPAVAKAACEQAKQHGTSISYDLNYRASLYKAFGGLEQARAVNRELMPFVDVVFGNEEDFSAALGFEVEGAGGGFDSLPIEGYRDMLTRVVARYPNLTTLAVTLRVARSASTNDWGALAYHEGEFFEVTPRPVEIYDRVGGGDSFASGFIHGLLEGRGADWALSCGVAHGALAMSTPGDTTMVREKEVLSMMQGGTARIDR